MCLFTKYKVAIFRQEIPFYTFGAILYILRLFSNLQGINDTCPRAGDKEGGEAMNKVGILHFTYLSMMEEDNTNIVRLIHHHGGRLA